MSRQLEARMVHVTDQCLAALAGRQGPASTGEVADAIGQPRNEPITWRALAWLVRQGTVTRVDMPDSRSTYWQRVDTSVTDLETLLDENDREAGNGD